MPGGTIGTTAEVLIVDIMRGRIDDDEPAKRLQLSSFYDYRLILYDACSWSDNGLINFSLSPWAITFDYSAAQVYTDTHELDILHQGISSFLL